MTKKINASRLHKESSFSVRWAIDCEQGTKLEDLSRPEFYSNIANRVNKNDTIRAFFEDGSYIVDLVIIEIDKQNITPVWVKTLITGVINIEKAKNLALENKSKKDKEETKEETKEDKKLDFNHPLISLKFRGPVKKWSVIRKEDGAILQEELQSKEQAVLAAQEIFKELS
jgi:hypothetical protein